MHWKQTSMEQLASLRNCLEPPAATGKRDSHRHHRPAQICTDGHAMDAVKEVAQSSLSSQSTATTAVGWSTGLHEYFVRCGSATTTELPSPVSSKSDDSDRAEELGELGEPFGVLQFGARLSCKEEGSGVTAVFAAGFHITRFSEEVARDLQKIPSLPRK